MNEPKIILGKILVSLIIPLAVVTIGGIIIYGNMMSFFFSADAGKTDTMSGPALIYYGISFMAVVLYYLLRQGYERYEFIALGIISLLYSFGLRSLTPQMSRPLYVFIIPILIFFMGQWAILKYFFLNIRFRQARLLIFAILCSALFTFAFWVQYRLLGHTIEADFVQSRFMSGVMLFVFLGFGLSLADYIIVKLDLKDARTNLQRRKDQIHTTSGDDEEDL